MQIQKLFLVAVACLPLAAQAPPNDDCVNALQLFDGINPGAPSGASGFYLSNVGGTESPGAASCVTGQPGTSDVWFVYSASTTGPHTFATCTPAGFAPGTLLDTIVEVYDLCGGVRQSCDDDACTLPNFGSSSTAALTSGSTYYVRVSTWENVGTIEGTFYLAVAPPTTPLGDDCGSAVLLPGNDGVFQGNTSGLAAPAPAPSPVCNAIPGTNVDGWWVFIAVVSGTMTVSREGSDSTATNGSDVAGATGLEVYDGNGGCFGWVGSVLCSAGTGTQLSFTVFAGGIYYIRLGIVGGAQQGPFLLYMTLQPAPINDDCFAATQVFDGTNPATGLFTNAAATPSAAAASCAGGAPGISDVFFSYTAVATGDVVVTTCTPPGLAAGSLLDTILEVYPACGGTALACGDDTLACAGLSKTSFSASVGSTYLFRVSSKATQTGTFYLSVHQSPPNDDCVGATPAALGANGPFLHDGATNSAVANPTCAATSSDIWFTFVPAITAILKVDGCGTSFDAVLAVYAVCGGTDVACDNDDLLNRGPCAISQADAPYLETPVVAGTTYWIRLGAATPVYRGTSLLTLSYKLTLTITPNAPGQSVAISVAAGTPLGTALNAITPTQGAFPNGWLYGVDIPFGELLALLPLGPPFLVPLDAVGGYSAVFGGPGYPNGVVLYCVAIDLGTNLVPFRASDPLTVML